MNSRIKIVVGDPATSLNGSVQAGFACLDGSVPKIVYDRSGGADVYSWPLLAGPV